MNPPAAARGAARRHPAWHNTSDRPNMHHSCSHHACCRPGVLGAAVFRVLIISSMFPVRVPDAQLAMASCPVCASRLAASRPEHSGRPAELHGGVNVGYGQHQVVKAVDAHVDDRRRCCDWGRGSGFGL